MVGVWGLGVQVLGLGGIERGLVVQGVQRLGPEPGPEPIHL